jgi:hypothetical protein
MGNEIKGAILETFPGLSDLLEEIPTCESEIDIEFCMNEPRETKGGRKKRAPSAYNRHTGICMKSGKSMKDCAADWKKQKAGG